MAVIAAEGSGGRPRACTRATAALFAQPDDVQLVGTIPDNCTSARGETVPTVERRADTVVVRAGPTTPPHPARPTQDGHGPSGRRPVRAGPGGGPVGAGPATGCGARPGAGP